MNTLPMAPPPTFHAGDSVRFTVAPTMVSGVPVSVAAGWTLQWIVNGVTMVTVTATGTGAHWLVDVTPTQSIQLSAGIARWALVASLNGVVFTLGTGQCHVRPNYRDAIDGDLRSFYERTVTVLEAAMTNTLTANMQLYMVEGQQVQRLSITQLAALHAKYVRLRDAERVGSPMGKVSVRFAR